MGVAERILSTIDGINRSIGEVVKWLVVATVLAQVANVVLRYVFSIGILSLQQSVWYFHALVFMLAAGYALTCDAHVRIDVLYRDAPARRRAWTDLLGSLLLLLPFCASVLLFGMPYVEHAWGSRESSAEIGGLPFVFLLKTVIPVFAVLLGLAAVGLALRAWLALRSGADRYTAAAPAARQP
ncbi:TRAP transporter small permease subunit [Faunimonas sp. B44]|uniref:TRAP transporter small permease subunit n=1 Tax=Faunimonas sp. B44 TaxID=3461493 RepID=UPI0040449880